MCYYNAQNSTCAFVYTRTMCGVQCNSILLDRWERIELQNGQRL